MIFKATILEEMPPFPERESSILAKLKKKRPDKVANNTIEPKGSTAVTAEDANSSPGQKPASVSSREYTCELEEKLRL